MYTLRLEYREWSRERGRYIERDRDIERDTLKMPTCPTALFINSFAHFFALGAGFFFFLLVRFAAGLFSWPGQVGQVYCRFSLRDLLQQQQPSQQQQQPEQQLTTLALDRQHAGGVRLFHGLRNKNLNLKFYAALAPLAVAATATAVRRICVAITI